MKLIFTPQRSQVCVILEQKISQAQQDLEVANKRLSELSETKLFVSEQDRKHAQNVADGAAADMEHWATLLRLLVSDTCCDPTIEVEL